MEIEKRLLRQKDLGIRGEHEPMVFHHDLVGLSCPGQQLRTVAFHHDGRPVVHLEMARSALPQHERHALDFALGPLQSSSRSLDVPLIAIEHRDLNADLGEAL